MDWVVTSDYVGEKLLHFLKIKLGSHYSTRQLKEALEQGRCRVNQKVERFGSSLLLERDSVSLTISDIEKKLRELEPERILFEDDYFLVYDKPAGIASDKNGLLSLFRDYAPKVSLIHRLDRDTTGVILLAKDADTYHRMVEAFRKYEVEKLYWALVDGCPSLAKGSLQNYMGVLKTYQGQKLWGIVSKEKGLKAHTDWKILFKTKEAALIACSPKTGRTHQLRVHMSGIGHPILGDNQYAKSFKCFYLAPRTLLHAYELAFTHPYRHEKLIIRAPLPHDFKKAITQLFPTYRKS